MWLSCLVATALTFFGPASAQSGTFLSPPVDNTAQALIGTFPEGSIINFQWNTTYASSDLVMFGYDTILNPQKAYGQAYLNNQESVSMAATKTSLSWTVELHGQNGNPDWLVNSTYLYAVFFLFQHGATTPYSRTGFYNFTREAVTTSSSTATSTTSTTSTSSGTTTTTGGATQTNTAGAASGLSTGAKAGIGVGAAIGGLAVLAGIAALLVKKGIIGGSGSGAAASRVTAGSEKDRTYYPQQQDYHHQQQPPMYQNHSDLGGSPPPQELGDGAIYESDSRPIH